MQIHSVQFVTSAAEPSQYPSGRPEVAFAGKSNVGKSSLINTLTLRKGLARTSNVPGRTRLINFFIVNDHFFLVDLPGYGYAAVPEAVRRAWAPMVESYLKNRPTLRVVVLVLDIRRDPDERDLGMIEWCRHYRIAFLIVLTKIDKIANMRRTHCRKRILHDLGNPDAPVVLFSARLSLGRDDLWKEIGRYLTV